MSIGAKLLLRMRHALLIVSILFVSTIEVSSPSAAQMPVPLTAPRTPLSIAWKPDGAMLAIAGGFGIQLYNSALDAIAPIIGPGKATRAVAWSLDETRIAAGYLDGQVRIWDATSGALLTTLKGHSARVLGLAWRPDNSKLASASFDATVKIWDVAEGSELLTLPHTAQVWSVAWSPDGQVLATGGGSSDGQLGTLQLWNAEDGSLLREVDEALLGSPVVALAFSADSRRLVSASSRAQVWDVASAALLKQFDEHDGRVESASISNDGGRIVSSSSENSSAYVWDANTGEMLQRLDAKLIDSVAFNPTRDLIVSGSREHVLRLWNAPNAEQIAVTPAPNAGRNILSNAFERCTFLDEEVHASLAEMLDAGQLESFKTLLQAKLEEGVLRDAAVDELLAFTDYFLNPPASPLLPSSGVGLGATYFTDPELMNVAAKRVDARIDFDWLNDPPVPGFPNDNFSVRWDGFIEPLYSEVYTLRALADDQVRVWIDEQLVIDQWEYNGYMEVQGQVALQAGHQHQIRIEYVELGGEARVHLAWSSEHQEPEIIRSTQLYPPQDFTELSPDPTPPGNGTGLNATYFSDMELVSASETRVDSSIDFDWLEDAPAPNLPADDFSVRWTGFIEPRYTEPYAFFAVADDGVRVWIDEQLVIDQWDYNGYEEVQGQIALHAGQRYPMRVEYREIGGEARIHLGWASSRQSREVVPMSQLYPSQ